MSEKPRQYSGQNRLNWPRQGLTESMEIDTIESSRYATTGPSEINNIFFQN